MANYVQDGDSIDYTPSADVAAGAVVVQTDLVGVAKRAIPANTPGSLVVSGVFDFPKPTGPGTGTSAGTLMYWSTVAQQALPVSAGNKFIGKQVKDSSFPDTTVRIRLSQ